MLHAQHVVLLLVGSSCVHRPSGCWKTPSINFSVWTHPSENESLRCIPPHPQKEMNLQVFFCIISNAASWLSVFLTASNSSFIILCCCSHTQWYFYPWNSHRVTPNARLPTSDAERNFQQSFFFFFLSLIPCWRPTSVVSLEIMQQQTHILFLLFCSLLFSAEAATVPRPI